MAAHVSETPRNGLHGFWAVLLVVVPILALTGVGYAAGRNSVSIDPSATVRVNSSPQVTHMTPWMQAHVGDIAWMQQHIGDVAWMMGHWNRLQWMQGHPGYVRWMQTHPAQSAWMRGHMASIRWMQTHQTQWSWMTSHMGDIGYMHDHWGQWTGWRSDIMGSADRLGQAAVTQLPTAAGAVRAPGWVLAWIGKSTPRSYGRWWRGLRVHRASRSAARNIPTRTARSIRSSSQSISSSALHHRLPVRCRVPMPQCLTSAMLMP